MPNSIEKAIKSTEKVKMPLLTGRRISMEPFGTRIPPDEAAILRKAAKKYECNCADLLRTAWSEWIANHTAELA